MKAQTLVFSLTLLPSLIFAQRDTINRYDSLGYKTGFWQIKAGEKKLPEYKPKETLEEGRYIENRKEGTWKKYYPGGALRYEITFKKDRVEGPARIYYENGCIEEEGVWKNNHWIGEYRQYSKDSCSKLIQKLIFDEHGLREGKIISTYPENTMGLKGRWIPFPDTSHIHKIKTLKEFYESELYKKLEFNHWSLRMGHMRKTLKGVSFDSDFHPFIVTLEFKKPVRNDYSIRSERSGGDIKDAKLIWKRKLRKVSIEEYDRDY